MCDEECLDNVKVIALWLGYSLRLCASTWAMSLKVTLVCGSISHCMVGVPEGHSLSLFQPGVLKGVISVTFELFGLFHVEMFLKGGAVVTDLLQIFPISGCVVCCLSSLLPRGRSTRFHGELSSTVFHGGLSSVYGGCSGCLGVTVALGLLAVGLSAARVGSCQCSARSWLVLLLF